MAELTYKTRGMSNPQGKPRVYFCCHPDCYDKYFDSVSDEILAQQNCSIWYLKDSNARRDYDFLEDLKQMQLFVMPVTSSLLGTLNPALDIEFKFAVEHNIPVLPLMLESGLEFLFNQKCGDLQFLDCHAIDHTALPYKDKLKKYLSSVLLGDELIQKIKTAFCAYAFLSYRKKDRKYAQELMRLVHKNDFFRDVAIWYDEFLTPGENFNDSIHTALQKSDLFLLAVTPNLVMEPNYVMTTEYPMARQLNKPLLALELLPTNPVMLAEKYNGISKCVNAHNSSALSTILQETFANIPVKNVPDSPEHNFLIGLAYLNGIDVELDTERGIALITSAANAGLEDAIRKMIDIYENGIGTPIDHQTAAHWQEVLANQILHQLSVSKYSDLELFLNYLIAVLSLGANYYNLHSFDVAMKHYNMVLQASKKFSWYLGLNSKLLLSACYNNMAVIYSETNHITEAVKLHKKALELRNSLLKQHPDKVIHDLLDSYINLGIEYEKNGQCKKALKILHQAESVYDVFYQKIDIAELKLAQLQKVIGSVYYSAHDFQESIHYYEKALQLYDKFMKHPTIEITDAFADLSYKLGIYYNETAEFEQSLSFFCQARTCYCNLSQLDESTYAENVARTQYELALLYKDNNDAKQALKEIQHAILFWGVAKSHGKDTSMEAARSHKVCGELFTTLKQFDSALTHLANAEQYLSGVPLNYHTATDFISLYNAYGRTYYRSYQNDAAQESYHKAYGIYQKFYSLDKDKKHLLGMLYYNFALLSYHNYHNKAAAREMIDKAIKTLANAPNGATLYATAKKFKAEHLS